MRPLNIAKQITNRGESPALQKYLEEIAEYPKKDIEEEVELFNMLNLLNPDNKELPKELKNFDLKTKKAIEKVVDDITKANLRFVVSVAKQYQQQNIELLDLINEWNIWLVKAIYRFDYTKWFKFISYAVWRIRQSILQHLQESKFIRYPANRWVYVNKINKFIRRFQQINLRLPEEKEVCEWCDITQEDYERYLAVTCSKKISLDSKINPDEDDSKTIWETATMSQHNSIKPTDSGIMEQTEINRVLELRLSSGSEMLYKYAFVCVLKFWLNPGWINPDGIGIERTDEEIVEKFLERGLFIKTESVRSLFDRAKKKLATILTPDWEIREEYKVYMEKLKANNPISDIFIKYSKEKITQALEQLSKTPQTRSQAKVFSLKYWIPNNDRNLKWETYDIKDIAGMLGRSKWSVQHTLDLAIKNLNDILSQPEIIPEPWNSIPDSNIPKPLSNIPDSNISEPLNSISDNKVYAEPRDTSDVNYRRPQIEKALTILENTIKKKIWLRVFRLYYWLNPDWKVYDGHTIAETLVKKPYTTTMHIRKNIEENILNTIEWIDSSKLNKILENLKKSCRTTIIVDKTRDASDVNYRRPQIEKALNLLKQEQESERKKGNQKRDWCEVFNLYYFSVDPDDWKLYTAKKIAKKEGISSDWYVTSILKNTTKEIRYKLGIDSFKMNQVLKNLKKSNNVDIKQVLEEPQRKSPEAQNIPQNIDSFGPKEPEKEFPDAQNIPQSEVPTDHQKEASIPTKITDIPDVIDLERKIKTALEELRQEIENEDGRGKSNRKRNWCDVLNLYYFSVNPDDWKLYSNDKIANQLWISSGAYVSIILKKTKTRLAEKLWIDTDTLADILKKLRERNRDDIKNILE